MIPYIHKFNLDTYFALLSCFLVQQDLHLQYEMVVLDNFRRSAKDAFMINEGETFH